MWDDKDFQTSRFCWALFCEFFFGHFWDRIFGNGWAIGATYGYCPYDSSSQNWMIGSGGHGFDGKKHGFRSRFSQQNQSIDHRKRWEKWFIKITRKDFFLTKPSGNSLESLDYTVLMKPWITIASIHNLAPYWEYSRPYWEETHGESIVQIMGWTLRGFDLTE